MDNQIIILNPFTWFYVSIYLLFLFLLVKYERFNLGLPLIVFLIYGVIFTLIAFLGTRGNKNVEVEVRNPQVEVLLVLISFVIVILYLVYTKNYLEHLDGGWKLLAILFSKLFFFVVVPSILLWVFVDYKFYELAGNLKLDKTLIVPTLVLSLFSVLMNMLIGQEFQSLKNAEYTPLQILLGSLFVYIWLMIEVGLVEEFFFRALMQERFSAYFKSDIAGISIMAILFGLTHAPGIFLKRTSIEILGDSPSLLLSVGYTIVVISMISFFFAIIWIRTHNLTMLILIHAAFDFIPRFSEIYNNFYF